MCIFATLLVTGSQGIAGKTEPEEWIPSEMAAENLQTDSGLSFRVEAADDGPILKRTSYVLSSPGQRRNTAYWGDADTVFEITFGERVTGKPGIEQETWDHQRLIYSLSNSGKAELISSRLSPAVLLESSSGRISLRTPGTKGLQYLSFIHSGEPVVHKSRELSRLEQSDLTWDEPWLLVWFGIDTPIRGYSAPRDVDDRLGVNKPGLEEGVVSLDLPVLLRFEHRISSISADDEGELALNFHNGAGKIAIMPLMGGRVFLPSGTEKWLEALPSEILDQCRLWSARLRDYPLTVRETFSVNKAEDILTVKQEFGWISFQDDWDSPSIRAAPVPPMLALALGGGVPVRFFQGDKEVEPVDYRFMDTAGKAMGIEGVDSYEYRIYGLGSFIWFNRDPSDVPEEAKIIQKKLEKHVQDMVDAGHLAPLLYIHGGIGGTRFSNYYWVGSPELAYALSKAYPYLSSELQKEVREYLKMEWASYPPFQIEENYYRSGESRTPYEIPWDDIGRHEWLPMDRDRDYRKQNFLFDLYRADAYYDFTGEKDDPGKFRDLATKLIDQLISHQDWAIMGPARLRNVTDIHRIRYFNLQGQATYNSWLAGAIGFTRLARKYGWDIEEDIGHYLVGKLAMARVGQARYVAEMHRMGNVPGDEKDDWRALAHIDATCAVVGWGPLGAGVHEEQEFPPFIDLVEEVGYLLAEYARDECRIYLDYLDYAVPYWYLSEAPKQSATEHRTCPLQHLNGNVLAQYWILGKRGKEFVRYVDTTRFRGDLYYIQNLSAAIDSFTEETP